MKKAFVETRVFTARRKARLDDEALRALQNELMAHPDKGDVLPGCGGLRKLRFADIRRGKGKRGGVRIIYLHIAEMDRIDFMTIYGKDEKDDLNKDDKKILQLLAEQARLEAKRKER